MGSHDNLLSHVAPATRDWIAWAGRVLRHSAIQPFEPQALIFFASSPDE